MPLTWTIDPDQRLVTAVAEGGVTRAEFDAYLDAIEQADAHAYRKLFDGSHGTVDMAAEEVLALGVRMRSSHATGQMGALAVVVPGDVEAPFARALGMLATAERPMRVFRAIGPARKWIERVPK